MYAFPQAPDNPDSSLYLRDKSEPHGAITYFTQKNSMHWRFLVTWLRRTYPMERVVENAELKKSAIKITSNYKRRTRKILQTFDGIRILQTT